jgi:general secretion pathway protein D
MRKLLPVLICIIWFSQIFSVDNQRITRYYRLNYISGKEFRYLTERLLPSVSIDVNDEFKLVVVTNTLENINLFEDMLKKLDAKTPQIQISAKIVETKLSTTEKYGVNWTWQDFFSGTTKELKSYFENFLPGDSRYQLQFGTLRTDGVNAVINFLLTNTDTDLLSNPQVVTLDNKEANIITGDQIPIRTTTTQGNVTVTSTVFKEIGVRLKVTPSLKQGDFILLDVHPEVSEVLEYSPITGDPIISQRKVDGSVIIRDNETVMVGGLLKNKTILTENKVPVLGDIPLIGLLFKKQTTEKIKTEIIIFLTPHIIREGEKLIVPQQNNLPGEIK